MRLFVFCHHKGGDGVHAVAHGNVPLAYGRCVGAVACVAAIAVNLMARQPHVIVQVDGACCVKVLLHAAAAQLHDVEKHLVVFQLLLGAVLFAHPRQGCVHVGTGYVIHSHRGIFMVHVLFHIEQELEIGMLLSDGGVHFLEAVPGQVPFVPAVQGVLGQTCCHRQTAYRGKQYYFFHHGRDTLCVIFSGSWLSR